MLDSILKKVSKEVKFWNWFSKNENKYFNFESDQESLFDELNFQLNKLDENLTFEFSPVLESGKREFVISADGIISSFPAVIKLVEAAPDFEKWLIVAFRLPHPEYSQINYKDIILDFEDIYFRYSKDNGKIGLELNIRGYEDNGDWSVATYLILDNILGEYDVEMWLSWIERKKLNEAEIDLLYNITELPGILNEYRVEFQN